VSESGGDADWLRLIEWQGQPAGALWACKWRDQLLFAVEGKWVRAAERLLMHE